MYDNLLASSGCSVLAFSISLAVRDIATSQAFYEKLGFKVFMGEAAKNWPI